VTEETSKSLIRRGFDRRLINRYFVGHGIDIGAGSDSLGRYAELFPLMSSCYGWDLPDGDAMLMAGVPDDYFDFVHSSHCLEHLHNPYTALSNWIRICKPHGHLIIIVPDEDLYEQGTFPSNFNPDHKHSFTINKASSWSPQSVNVFDLLDQFAAQIKVLKIELLDANYLYNIGRTDQTTMITGESAVELILQKQG
jgi:SAM-dependent methyltransferase